MTITIPGLDGLRKHRGFCLHEQPGAEARQVSQIGEQLRQARIAAGYSRAQLARVLCLDCELLVAVENGYGDLSTAQSLFRQAQRLCSA